MDKIKINLYGIGCTIVQGAFDETEWANFTAIAQQLKSPLNEIIFENSFYTSIPKYKSWHSLGNKHKYIGLLTHHHSTIEIRANGRQKRRIAFADLIGENLLFPLYQTTFSKVIFENDIQRSIVIIEKEIGAFASYELKLDNFSLDKLHFEIKQITINNEMDFTMLSKVEYDGKKLTSKKSDTVVKECFALLCEGITSMQTS